MEDGVDGKQDVDGKVGNPKNDSDYDDNNNEDENGDDHFYDAVEEEIGKDDDSGTKQNNNKNVSGKCEDDNNIKHNKIFPKTKKNNLKWTGEDETSHNKIRVKTHLRSKRSPSSSISTPKKKKQTKIPFVKSPDSALAHSLHIQELLMLTRDAFKKENLRPTKKKDSKDKNHNNNKDKENKQN